MQGRRIFSPLCIAIALFAVILIGLGVYLITVAFTDWIIIGVIAAGVLLLVNCCSRFIPQVVCCILLFLVSLFLVVAAIVAVPIDLVVGIILAVLAVIALLLAAICFAITVAARRFGIQLYDED